MIKAVISDFGGVITNPLIEGFTRAHAELGIPVEDLGTAMRLAAERDARAAAVDARARPADRAATSSASSRRSSTEVTGKPVELDGYGRRLMHALEPNTPLLDYYRRLRDEHGLRLAVLTNNVREWQPIWRARFAIDELFELVVDSGFEGTRKPEPEIYALTLERLGPPRRGLRLRRRRRGQRDRRPRGGHARHPLPRHRPGDRGAGTR